MDILSLAKKYFDDTKVVDETVQGYVEDESSLNKFLSDLDCLTGGFTRSSTHERTEDARLVFCSEKKDVKLKVPFFGCPFKCESNVIYECIHAGKKRVNEQKKQKDLQNAVDHPEKARKSRVWMHDSKKLDCKAVMVIRKIKYFETFNIKDDLAKASTRKVKKLKKETLAKVTAGIASGNIIGTYRYILLVPLETAHCNHPVGIQLTLASKQMKPEIKERISELVANGVVKAFQVEVCLKDFVEGLFRNQDIKPSPFDQSWYPSKKNISNHIHLSTIRQKLNQIDQVNLSELVKKWKGEDPQRNFHVRPCTKQTEVLKDSVGNENCEESMVNTEDNNDNENCEESMANTEDSNDKENCEESMVNTEDNNDNENSEDSMVNTEDGEKKKHIFRYVDQEKWLRDLMRGAAPGGMTMAEVNQLIQQAFVMGQQSVQPGLGAPTAASLLNGTAGPAPAANNALLQALMSQTAAPPAAPPPMVAPAAPASNNAGALSQLAQLLQTRGINANALGALLTKEPAPQAPPPAKPASNNYSTSYPTVSSYDYSYKQTSNYGPAKDDEAKHGYRPY